MAETHNESVQKLRELIGDVDIAMLTTMDQDQSLRSRPMGTQQTEFDGDIWFFTKAPSGKVKEIEHNSKVNVSYSKPSDQLYVSVSGNAEVSHDRAKMEELWNPLLKAWFPDGLEDPDIALLKIHVDKAEYWDSPSGTLVALAGFVKAIVTGEQADGGENEKINL